MNFTEMNVSEIEEDGKVRVIPEYVTKQEFTPPNHGKAMKGINGKLMASKPTEMLVGTTLQMKEKSIITVNPKSKILKLKKVCPRSRQRSNGVFGVEMDKLIVELEVWE